MKLEPIVVSLLDTDLYKFNMDQVIFHKHTDLCGQYYFKCRNKGIVFTDEMVQEINDQIDHLCTLSFKNEELDYIRSIRFIKNDYGTPSGTTLLLSSMLTASLRSLWTVRCSRQCSSRYISLR